MSYLLTDKEIEELENLNASERIQRLAIIRHDLRDIIIQQKSDQGIADLKKQLATLKDQYKRSIDQKQGMIEMIIKTLIIDQQQEL